MEEFDMKKKLFGYALVGVVSATVVLVVAQFISNDKIIVVQEKGGVDTHTIAVSKLSDDKLPNFRAAAKKSIDAVVHVKTAIVTEAGVYYHENPLYDFFFGPQYKQEQKHQLGSGSGVIVSNDGYIVTNNHVIDKANQVEVVLNDKRTFKADVVGKDLTTDIALLKIDADDLPFLTYGDSDELEVGDWVLAVGNPFNLNSTVTAGIVSAKARNLNILSRQYSIESFIQTDAAVNPGNSGGALVNTNGDLIGINTAIASNTGSFSGYSFAIPTSIVKKIVADLVEFGQVQRAFIGINVLPIDEKIADELGLEKISGVLVAKVSETGAAKDAGVNEGDVILRIENNEINSFPELQEQVSKYRPGDKIDVTVFSKGKEKTRSVLLRNRYGKTDLIKKQDVVVGGAKLDDVEPSILMKLRLESGVAIVELDRGVFRNAGIKKGFIITAINKKQVYSSIDILDAFNVLTGAIYVTGVYPNGISATYIVYNR